MISLLDTLASSINRTNEIFLDRIQRQVNAAYTLRNWVIGYYIIEFEQQGGGRASYNSKLLAELSAKLKKKGIKGMSETNLKLFRQFYLLYPQIRQTVSDEFEKYGIQLNEYVFSDDSAVSMPGELLSKLSFSHFIELFKADSHSKRTFYETEVIRNNWSVRQLQRAMNSMQFERTSLGMHRIIQEEEKSPPLLPDHFFKDPYILEFLGLEEKPGFNENDLENCIIDHLQSFLLEMGKGFCFEARQKRITFDNTHYRIDLVFYHRILKCHVLVDLKIGEFTHADAGQMNMYLNYYRENEMQDGDNPPAGIVLCAGKNESLVKYATAGLAHKLFVSKYMINLPSEEELKQLLEQERKKAIT